MACVLCAFPRRLSGAAVFMLAIFCATNAPAALARTAVRGTSTRRAIISPADPPSVWPQERQSPGMLPIGSVAKSAPDVPKAADVPQSLVDALEKSEADAKVAAENAFGAAARTIARSFVNASSVAANSAHVRAAHAERVAAESVRTAADAAASAQELASDLHGAASAKLRALKRSLGVGAPNVHP
eukprot:TRINITY_DN68339_c0_g1_i1.p2 TRINITY_DN68339_c0_g1~~TRINITY_DN68339_c0_g1_i1.p2  ORF type:complete len:215 (-),score=36.46 TRINITY_DN68339_c0_g1_i1:63-620(-)